MTQREAVFAVDTINESVVIAAALVSDQHRARLLTKVAPDAFLHPDHRAIWETLRDLQRRQLVYDPATANTVSGGAVNPVYLQELAQRRPTVPDNLEFHLRALLWDKAKHTALVGPVQGLLAAMQDPKESPERVRSLADQVGLSLKGHEDRQHLWDPEELVRTQMIDVRARMSGRAVYPYGLDDLDYYPLAHDQAHRARRIASGSVPGEVTVITGVPGIGKSTVTARLVLGLARQRRRILYGAWEQNGGTTLELLAVMSLGWSRSALIDPRSGQLRGFSLDEERLGILERRMLDIGRFVRFLRNPFRRRRGQKPSNEANLDIIEGYIADSACDVFVADLWKRALHKTDPEEEELALYQQQTMAEERRVHCILVQQQRLKDVESRTDKRPTREGIKGSGTWTEIADTILGVHRIAAWKPVEDNVIEIDVLKQRRGKWPLAIEFDWDGDTGSITNGRSIEYEQAGAEDRNKVSAGFRDPRGGGRGR